MIGNSLTCIPPHLSIRVLVDKEVCKVDVLFCVSKPLAHLKVPSYHKYYLTANVIMLEVAGKL